ncbi:nicotinate phosphoribosyltransferase-like isoform X2 [Ornithodoros turicata]|uniref:nicotinate phosphoribosyltransferase-like isoform X2 n=1 Tax=Ornithodoros turicata TaxID=34597 RepID=UPI00313A185E
MALIGGSHHGPEARTSNSLRIGIVQPLLTDLYQITMAYAYWKNGKHNDCSVFDLFFRKNPFQGEFTVFAGLEDCIRFLQAFHYSDDDITYLKNILPPHVEPGFFEYLSTLNANQVKLYGIPEGTVVFPRIPLIRVEGPLAVLQLFETTLLNLVNYASLVTTNAARFRMAAGSKMSLLEFGLRRAQGPDGGLSASKYSYLGGFDGTSNVLAGKLFNIPLKGTHAHAFIMSFSSKADCKVQRLKTANGENEVDFLELCYKWRKTLCADFNCLEEEASEGEFIAFVSYAAAFPTTFLALVDTYDVIRTSSINKASASESILHHADDTARSGLLNFSAVAMALNELGYRPTGIRIDSGDLAYLSKCASELFGKVAEKYSQPWFKSLLIVASNDINEETIISLNEQGHRINSFGIGTHLVTCQKQPALGCVYKLVEVNNQSCIKLSLDIQKVTIPSKKACFRLYGQEGYALLDLMQRGIEPAPEKGKRVLCRHPFQESKRCYVTPDKVENLSQLWWEHGKIVQDLPSLDEIRSRLRSSLETLRPDIKRTLNPTPYKVSVSDTLYSFMHDLWLRNAPIGELS